MDVNAKSPGDPVRVLIVDDETGFVDVLSNRLGKRGFAVTKTFSGTQAIRALRKQDFDVAILDLKMEDMDGVEVLKVFKMMDPRMEVIMLTGHGSETAATEGMASGAFDYLTKPCDLAELVKKINAAARHAVRLK